MKSKYCEEYYNNNFIDFTFDMKISAPKKQQMKKVK